MMMNDFINFNLHSTLIKYKVENIDNKYSQKK